MNRLLRIAAAVFTLAIGAVICMLWRSTSEIDALEARQAALSGLEALEAAISRDVLLARSGLLANYDRLTQNVDRSTAIAEASFRGGPHSQELLQALAQQERAVEDFKRVNALAQTTFAHLRRETPSLAARLEAVDPELALEVSSLGYEVLTGPRAPTGAIEALAARAAALDGERGPAVRRFTSHALRLGEFRAEVDGAVTRLSVLRTADQIAALRAATDGKLAERAISYRRERVALGSGVALLLATALGAYAAISRRNVQLAEAIARARGAQLEVRMLAGSLEARVLERTRTLDEARGTLAANVKELEATRDRLLLADRMNAVGQMAAGVAHEINNPLTYVMSNLEFVKEELSTATWPTTQPELREAVVGALDDAATGAARVAAIVKSLKTFSRVEEDSKSSLDPHQVIESSIAMAIHVVRHRAQLVRDYGDVPRVVGNAGRLGQVVLNLVVNAAQAFVATDPTRNEIRVVTRRHASGGVLIQVRDNGPGIPAQVLPKLFTPFFTTKPVGTGTGLGLSVAMSIVGSMGGTISAESPATGGALFSVLLPSGAGEPRADPAPGPAAPAFARRARVMLIDDEELIGRALEKELGRQHDVVFVRDPTQAVERLCSDEPFDVVLCDLMMPSMSGMEVAELVRRKRPARLASLVFLTGGACTPEARAFLGACPHEVVEKPVSGPALARLLSRFLGTPAALVSLTKPSLHES